MRLVIKGIFHSFVVYDLPGYEHGSDHAKETAEVKALRNGVTAMLRSYGGMEDSLSINKKMPVLSEIGSDLKRS